MAGKKLQVTDEEALAKKRRYKADWIRAKRAANPISMEDRQKSIERCRIWYLNNKERSLEARRAWRKANPDRAKATNNRYYKENIERKRVITARYRAKATTKAHDAEYRREYSQLPEAKLAARDARNRRRALQMGCEARATRGQISELLMTAVACGYCETPFSETTTPTIDHFVSLKKGGAHAMHNLTVACGLCNSRKGTLDAGEFARRYNFSVPPVGNYSSMGA